MSIPESGTSQWKKNEKLIMSDPMLKKARDQAQGMEDKGTIRTNSPSAAYKDNWERAFGKYKGMSDEQYAEAKANEH